jgi:hypothetical protein
MAVIFTGRLAPPWVNRDVRGSLRRNYFTKPR